MPALPTDVAATQHGLLTTGQLRSAALTTKQIQQFVTRGQLQRMAPRLFRVAGAPATDAQRLLAAVLEAGATGALSHTSALAWWKVCGFSSEPIHVTRTRSNGRRRHQLADRVHRTGWLPEDHVRVLDGVPVVVPARALFDFAGLPGVHHAKVERAVDNAWAERLVSGQVLHAMMRQVEGQRRPGVQMMREILASRGEDYVPPASGLEGRVVQILRRAGERPLRRQANCGDEDGWIGRVDFVDDEVPFILEVQSERFHTSLLDRKADRERIARLEAAGFVVATVTDTEVWHHPFRVVEIVRSGRSAARVALLTRMT